MKRFIMRYPDIAIIVLGVILVTSNCFALDYFERKVDGLCSFEKKDGHVFFVEKQFDANTGQEIASKEQRISSDMLLAEKDALLRRIAIIDEIVIDVLAEELK